MSRLALFIRTRAKPGRRDEIRRLWEAHLKPRAAENPAQVLYCFATDDADRDVLHIFELYEHRAALEAAAQAPWFAAYMESVGPLPAAPPEVSPTTPVWAKGAAV